MERELERLYDMQQPTLDEAAADRDVLFATAEDVSGQLARMGNQLYDAIDAVRCSAQHCAQYAPQAWRCPHAVPLAPATGERV